MRKALLLSLTVLIGACAAAPYKSSDNGKTADAVTTATTPASTAKTTPASDAPAVVASSQPLDAMTRKKAEMLTSIWENGTTILQYEYCENIDDGRGYTSGRAGFCTGTGDAMLVIQCMGDEAKTKKYLLALGKLNDKFLATEDNQADVSTIDAVGDYCADWKADAASAKFHTCQDSVTETLYVQTALAQMSKHGLTSALSYAALFDAEINHGNEGKQGVEAMATQATAKAAATIPGIAAAGDDEDKWLEAFLAIRIGIIGADPTWADAVDRVAMYEQLRRDGNFDLSKPLVTTAHASTVWPGHDYKNSGYPKCTIAADGSVTGAADCTDPNMSDDDDDN
jgi:chitosanase